MSIDEIANQVASLTGAWEEFKRVNDERLKAVESKKADGLLDDHVERINNALDEQKARIEQMHAAMNRPGAGKEHTEEAKEAVEYREAFKSYVRKGMESKALSVQSDPDGGYLVTPQVSSRINQVIFETSPMRQLCTVETISTDSLDIMDDANEAASGWAGGEVYTASESNTPQIGKRNIPVHELYAQPKATQKLIDDASVDIEAWLAAKIADTFARKQNTAFVSGSGVGQPRGILTYANGTSWGQIEQVNSGSSGAVTADGLINLYYALKSDYARNASFLANRAVVKACRLLKDTTNQYLWQPGLALGQPDTLLGAPVLMASDMPTAAANSLSIACGDFKRAYTVVDRIGIRTLRDPFTEKPYVKFYSTVRVGGDVCNFEAIKLLKLA